MQIAITGLLFVVFAIHKYFIDQKKVEQLESAIEASRYPRFFTGVFSLLFLGYIILWVVLSSKFIVAIDNLIFGY